MYLLVNKLYTKTQNKMLPILQVTKLLAFIHDIIIYILQYAKRLTENTSHLSGKSDNCENNNLIMIEILLRIEASTQFIL